MLKEHVQGGGRLLFNIGRDTYPIPVNVEAIKNEMVIFRATDIGRLERFAQQTTTANFVGKDATGRDFMCPDLKLMFSVKNPGRIAVEGTAPCVYSDRRMHPRYMYDCELTMQVMSHGEFLVVHCRDISTGGISFYFNPYIKELSKIVIDVLNVYTGKRHVYNAVVQHSMTDSKGKWYGCQFKDPDEWLVELTNMIVDDLLDETTSPT